MIIVRRVEASGHTHQFGKDVRLDLVCDEAGLRVLAEAAQAQEWHGGDVVAQVLGAWLR